MAVMTLLTILAGFRTKTAREARFLRLANEFAKLRPLNQSLESIGSATNFQHLIRDVLSSIMQSAIANELLTKNPMEHVKMPPKKRGIKRNKPYVTPAQFEALVNLMAEPYATMTYVAVYNGLRVSELIGLRWDDVLDGHLAIDERCCRGDWAAPKSEAGNDTIPVNAAVIERIHRLKTLTVEVKAGRAIRP